MIQGLDSRFAVSFWVLVEKPCSNHLCGLLLHIDAENNYATTSLFLTDTRKAVNHSNDFHSFLFCITYRIHFCLICSGKIHIQVHGDTGHTSAFLSPFKVPLHQWCRHSLEILGRVVRLYQDTYMCNDLIVFHDGLVHKGQRFGSQIGSFRNSLF